MSKNSANQYRLEKLKKQAKKIAKSEGITQTEALEIVASNNGFQSWFDCRSKVLNGANLESIPAPKSNPKIFANEFDPEIHSPEDVRGLQPAKEGEEARANIRHSFLNFIGEEFDSTNTFRNRLESSIRKILGNSKNHTEIHIEAYADSSILSRIENAEKFFDSILDRYLRLTTLHIIERDEPITFDEYQTLINGGSLKS